MGLETWVEEKCVEETGRADRKESNRETNYKKVTNLPKR
jgi:hypothetical protein